MRVDASGGDYLNGIGEPGGRSENITPSSLNSTPVIAYNKEQGNIWLMRWR